MAIVFLISGLALNTNVRALAPRAAPRQQHSVRSGCQVTHTARAQEHEAQNAASNASSLRVPMPRRCILQDLKKAKGHVWGVVYGFIAVLFLTPCLGFAMREIPLDPQLFAIGESPPRDGWLIAAAARGTGTPACCSSAAGTCRCQAPGSLRCIVLKWARLGASSWARRDTLPAGLMIFCLVPTTLGIGVALVRSCKGNEGVAIVMTVGTNMIGVVRSFGGRGVCGGGELAEIGALSFFKRERERERERCLQRLAW